MILKDIIPNDWKLIKLGELTDLITKGTTPTTNGFSYTEEGVNFIKVESIHSSGNFIHSMFAYVGNDCHESFKRSQLKEDDILFTIAGALGRSAIVKREILPANTNQAVAIIRLKNTDYKKYIYQYLRGNYIKNLIEKINVSTAQANLSLGQLNHFDIPLPSLPEQQKIAEILSTVDEKIEAIDQRISETQDLKKGLMQQLLTEGIGHTKFKDSPLGEIPESWEVVISSEIFELIHGYQFREYDFTETGLPIVKIGQLNSKGEIDMTNCSYFSKDRAEEFSDKKIYNGDVLMALTGATLGKSCWVSGLEFNVYQNYRVGKFEPKDENILSKRYLYFLIGSPLVLNQIFAKVNSGAQGNIGKSDFEKLKITLPSIKEQNKISEILSNIDEKLQIQQDKKTEYQELKKGLMQQLLTGKIRVKI